MNIKKFFISLIKNLIILLIATFIFSAVSLDFTGLLAGVFGDIYEYANPEIQKRVIAELAETCSSLDRSGETATIQQLCTNRSMLDSMKENCRDYRESKRKGLRFENEEQIQETCLQVESGEIERQCRELEKSSLLPDFSKIGILCKDYKARKMSDKEFFYTVVSSPLSSQELPDIGVFDKYNRTIEYLNSNKILYFIILSILLILLYLLVRDNVLFLITLTGISFSIGILILLPYFGILIYDKFIGIDTTSILGSMFGLGDFDFKAILSVVLLLLLRTYNNFIITAGILFLVVGVAGKFYKTFLYEKKQKGIKLKKSKKLDKLFGELKEEMKKRKKS